MRDSGFGRQSAAMTLPTPDQINAAKLQVLLSYLTRQVEAGKWLLASLLLINGGAIAGLLSTDKVPAIALAASGRYFVSGVGLAFASGIMSWGMADSFIAILRQDLGVTLFPKEAGGGEDFNANVAVVAAFAAFACLIGSLVFFGLGAITVTDAIAAKVRVSVVRSAKAGKQATGGPVVRKLDRTSTAKGAT